MNRLCKSVDVIVTGMGMAALLGLIAVAFIQVFFRYVLNNALPWPEEVCRFTFIILAYAGMVMTMGSDGHLRVDMALTFASPSVRAFLNALALAGGAVYCALAAWYTCALLLAVKDMHQMATTVNVAVYLTWIPIPLGFALTGLLAALRLFALIAGSPAQEPKGL